MIDSSSKDPTTPADESSRTNFGPIFYSLAAFGICAMVLVIL